MTDERKARGRRRVEKAAYEFIINARFIELTRDKLLLVAKRIGASARQAMFSSDGSSWLDIAAGLPILSPGLQNLVSSCQRKSQY